MLKCIKAKVNYNSFFYEGKKYFFPEIEGTYYIEMLVSKYSDIFFKFIKYLIEKKVWNILLFY